MIEPISAVKANQVSNPNRVLRSAVFGENNNQDYTMFNDEAIDIFVNSDTEILEKKYNLACQVAAYYKTQYENLLKNGNCLA